MIPKSLQDLRLFQKCREFIVIIYKLAKLLPDDEKYGLISQIKRAVLSILANIVEGYGRATLPDQLRFCYMALGSFREVECYLLVMLDVGYINREQYCYVSKRKDIVGGLLVNFIKSKQK